MQNQQQAGLDHTPQLVQVVQAAASTAANAATTAVAMAAAGEIHQIQQVKAVGPSPSSQNYVKKLPEGVAKALDKVSQEFEKEIKK